MTKKAIIPFVLLLIFGLVLFLLYPPMADMFGYEEFNDPESKDAPGFYAALIFFIVALSLLFFSVQKSGWKSSWLYLSTSIVIGIFFTAFAMEFLNKSNYYAPFNRVEWEKTPDKKPLEMARWIEKNSYGIDWTKNELIQKLGNAKDTNYYEGEKVLRYQLAHPVGYLDFVFDKGKVKKINMWCDCD